MGGGGGGGGGGRGGGGGVFFAGAWRTDQATISNDPGLRAKSSFKRDIDQLLTGRL